MSLLVLFQSTTGPPPGPPNILVQPADAEISFGDSATLTVVATGGTITYQWYIGVSGDTSNAISGATSDSLTVSPDSTTLYWVRLDNGIGTTDSSAATVTVLPHGGGGGPKKGKKPKRVQFADFATREELEKELKDAIKDTGMVVAKGEPLPVELPRAPEPAPVAMAVQVAQPADTAIVVSPEKLLEIQKRKREEQALLMILLSL